jgi:predicted RNA binding protein YcfA (HicA-like mRNA interferase family)
MKIRDVVRLLHEDGWFQVSQSGSHRQFKHPTKPGRVTIAGRPGQEIASGTLRSIARQAGIKVGRP